MVHLKTKFEKFISDAKRRRLYERESLAFEAAELISELMEKQNVSKSELATRIGASKSHITQVLSGSRNMTVYTLADLAFALGHKVGIESIPLDAVICPAERSHPGEFRVELDGSIFFQSHVYELKKPPARAPSEGTEDDNVDCNIPAA
jgi:transcriptional regulator with XRE-family HTH domain